MNGYHTERYKKTYEQNKNVVILCTIIQFQVQYGITIIHEKIISPYWETKHDIQQKDPDTAHIPKTGGHPQPI